MIRIFVAQDVQVPRLSMPAAQRAERQAACRTVGSIDLCLSRPEIKPFRTLASITSWRPFPEAGAAAHKRARLPRAGLRSPPRESRP